MTFPTLLLLAFSLFNLVIFLRALSELKKGNFYADVFWLIPLGIFVWGDALILAPFWALFGVAAIWLTPLQILRSVLVFFAIRGAYEVVYWINHQFSPKEYCGPLFRKVSGIGDNESAILYQLLNMIQVVVCLSALMLTFN